MNTAFPVKLLSQLRPLLIGFRKSKGLTQKELSARLGVTQQTYARLEANFKGKFSATIQSVKYFRGGDVA
jgi:transcriptional regulator with XRE-family HTH domain